MCRSLANPSYVTSTHFLDRTPSFFHAYPSISTIWGRARDGGPVHGTLRVRQVGDVRALCLSVRTFQRRQSTFLRRATPAPSSRLFKIQAGFRDCSTFCDSLLSFLAGFPYGIVSPAVQSRVKSIDCRRESEEWKRVKARPGGEVMMARSWAPVEDDNQSSNQAAFCAALKADQPAERVLGSKCTCRIDPKLSAGGNVERRVKSLSAALVLLRLHHPCPRCCCRLCTCPQAQGDTNRKIRFERMRGIGK